jgi:hypothetical protein
VSKRAKVVTLVVSAVALAAAAAAIWIYIFTLCCAPPH